MNIAVVVVLYNPDESVSFNILSYSNTVSKIYIIDNSNKDNSFLINKIPNAEYIPLYDNFGIAKALNIGCNKALKEGFEWCLTMDQDSYFVDNMCNNYLKIIESFVNKKRYYSFSCAITPHKNESLEGIVKNFIKKIIIRKKETDTVTLPKFEEIDLAITSGNIINLSVYQELGGFNELLFIDEVDHEFCCRLIQKCHKKILRINDIIMNHQIGESYFTIFNRVDYHDGIRLYYCVRNTLYMRDHFPEFEKKYKRVKFYKKVFWENCRDLKFKNIYFMYLGYVHYKKRIWGRYNGK